MAKVVDDDDKPWSARIRCAHPVFGRPHRVDGCFCVIEITQQDLNVHYDGEDYSCSVTCPKCGQQLYPEWQIGPGPIQIAIGRYNSRAK